MTAVRSNGAPVGSRAGSIKVAAQRVGLSVAEYTDRIARNLKRCTICGEWKSVSTFDADRARGDGRKASCRTCGKAMWRQRSFKRGPSRIPLRDDDRRQARARINADVQMGLRPAASDLYCALCGHKGPDRRHEYHHHLGYAPEHHYDVIALCSGCHHAQHRGE